mgnify:CR=1 FL=1
MKSELKDAVQRKKHYLISFEVRTKNYNYADNEFREEFIENLLSLKCNDINSYTHSCIVFSSTKEFSALLKILQTKEFHIRSFITLMNV